MLYGRGSVPQPGGWQRLHCQSFNIRPRALYRCYPGLVCTVVFREWDVVKDAFHTFVQMGSEITLVCLVEVSSRFLYELQKGDMDADMKGN